MNHQIIMRDGTPEYAVLPWDDYQALLEAAGRQTSPSAGAVPHMVPRLSDLSAIRNQKGMSQDELARSVGISPAYLALIEAGSRDPDSAICRALARALDVSAWEGKA